MKKMNLQALGLSVNDLLSREQMKKVMGGDGGSGAGSGGGDTCAISCRCSDTLTVNGHCSTTPCCVSGDTITCGSNTFTCSYLCSM